MSVTGRHSAAPVSYGERESAMQTYLHAGGEARAGTCWGIGGRSVSMPTGESHRSGTSPTRDGRCGFDVFENVLQRGELDDIEHDLKDILEESIADGAGCQVRLAGVRPALASDPQGARPRSGRSRWAILPAAPASPTDATR
jgi:hypothetical protein